MFANSFWQLIILAEAGGKPDPLKFDADLALFTLIIFVGLLLVLGKFAWKPIIEGLNNREKSINDQIESAENANAEAQASLKQYQDQMAAAADEAKAVVGEARKDAAAAKERMLAEAQEEAGKIKERAMADIEAAKNAAVRELAEKSVDSAVTLAGSIVGRSLEKGDHAKLIDDSINNFSGGA